MNCDCHVHIYDDAWPLAPTATFQPPHAPVSAYREVQQALGLQRVVVVQPTGYGFDNRGTLSAVAALGPEARGVAVVPPDVSDDELERLHAAGIRGVRFMMLAGGVLPWAALETMALRIADWGWHIDLQLNGHDLPLYETLLADLRCRLVIDHIGKFLSSVQPDSPGWLALRRLLGGGRCWVKLAAPYESSRSGPPAYADVAPLVHELASGHPERCLWASNWPHPNIRPEPSSAALMAWARAQVADDAIWRRMLVDNPAALYGF